jgi:phage gp36-like protein
MAYATGQELVKRYDVDLIGDLAQDEREPLDRSVVASHPNVAAALDDASGEIDVALLVGQRYLPEQLTTLTGFSRNHLVRITCAIAMSLLFERRPGMRPEIAEAIAKKAREHITALNRGDNVFGIQENLDAGTIDTATIATVDIENLNLLPQRMPRYFPGTEQRSPLGY